MATPTFTHDLTTITDGETTTGWTAIGGAMLSLDPDNKIQGSNSLGIPATANTVVGAVFAMPSAVDLFNKHLFIWLLAAQPGAVSNFAAGGVRIRVTGPTQSNFGEWTVGGSNTGWVSDGKWRLIVIDCNRPFDFTGGTPPVISAVAGATIQSVGATYLARITLMFGFGLNIDIMRYGTKFGVSGGTDSDPVTLQNIFNQDFNVDPTNNVFGLVTKNRAGAFEINGELRLGIEAGAGDTVFSSQNELIIFQDQPCALDYLKIISQQGTGTTKVKFGTGSGTGDARVGINGSVFDRINSVHGREYSLGLNASISLVEFYGSTVLRAKRGATFPSAIGHELISSSFASCGQISLGQILARKNIFSGHGLTDTGATTLNVAANPVDTGLITVTVAVAARTYTRSAGSYLTDGFAVGMVVTWSGFTNAVNNGKKVIESLTATVMTVTLSQTLVAEIGDGNERAVVAFGYTRSAGSFVTDGFAADQSIEVSGFTTSGNNGTRVITTVGATLITVNLDTGMAAETGNGDERIQQSGITGDGALLWNESIDIKNSSFLGNTNSAANAAAIQHPSAVGSPYTYDKLTFSGNNFDINNTSGSAITINALNGSNPVTSKGSAVTINNTVSVKITVKDANTLAAIENARVLMEAAAGGDLPVNVSVTIVNSGLTATVTHTTHGLVTGNQVKIKGASHAQNNGVFTITVTGASTYTYTMGSDPGSSPTGSITSTSVILFGLTDASGILQTTSFNFTNPQPVTGRVRRSTAAFGTKYKTGAITGTITSSGLDTTVLLIPDE